MPYIVNFTDRENKVPITVYDNTSSTDTSLVFPGRNVTGYGQIIAENFLALLENFSNTTAPINPVEGQLWYDSANGIMMLWDNNSWKAASNIQKSSVEPSVAESNIGELWVDTTNQQLYIFSGTRWILVGPQFSTGLRSGPIVESIIDSDGGRRVILTFYVEDKPMFIISRDSFTPKVTIPGFVTIRSGLNVTTDNTSIQGGFDPKLYSTALNADGLIVGGVEVPAGRFLRSDIVNTTEFGINVRNNSGITIGADGTFSLTSSVTAAKIYNSAPGSSLDLQINRDSIPETILRITDNRVGINNLVPDEALDVDGNIKTNGSVIITSVTESTNLNNGSIITSGGMAVGKNILVGNTLEVFGTTSLSNLQPVENEIYDCGTEIKRWRNVRTKTLIADTIQGVLEGNIVGNATTATNLRDVTEFNIDGDVTLTTPPVKFDGQIGGLSKTFNTQINSLIISGKSEPFPNFSDKEDFVLVFRAGTGLLKEKRDVFVGDLGVPIGAILPYAGLQAPRGYLFCDGSEVERAKFPDLYDIIGLTYGTPTLGVNTFKLPDLRGRFSLGRDNMDNGGTVPNSTGGFVDAGGGNADRVPGTEPDNIGGFGGQSSNSLIVANLPDHEHSMRGSTGQQYYATRIDTAAPLDTGAFSDKGPTTVGQSQYVPSSGFIKTTGQLGQPFSVMNPYLTLNYIIRSGPPAF